MEKKENIVLKLSVGFALKIIRYSEELHNQRKFVIANQLLKSGTSIGANIREAQSSESRSDFIHKFKIAAKEGEETEYWLLLCKHSENYPSCDHLLSELKSLQKIISKIIATAKLKSLANQHISKSAN
jgi:four helix bundle protein